MDSWVACAERRRIAKCPPSSCLPPLHAFCRPKGNEIICVKTIISAASAAASPCLAAFVRAVATVSIPTPAPALSLYGIP